MWWLNQDTSVRSGVPEPMSFPLWESGTRWAMRPSRPSRARLMSCAQTLISYALKELPQPQVDFTFGLLNLKPEPSSVST